MKTITPIFETRGKRRRLVAFRACYDGFEIGEFDTAREAERAIDEWLHEGLRRGTQE